MLYVQQYLIDGNSLSSLNENYGIKTTIRDDLVILNYSQIDSPKKHPIVMECRGLVLEIPSYRIVARSFPRFFNWGE
jgi:hypothetical protein